MNGAYTRGVLFVHSAPRALCPHIEWAAAEVLGARIHLDWTEQAAAPGMMRAETSWVGQVGTGPGRYRRAFDERSARMGELALRGH